MAKIGIGTTTPAATLDVKGAETVRGALTLPATSAATATKAANSQPQDLVASSFSSSTSKAVNQTFQWQAEPAANNTANPSGTLNLLFGSGTSSPAETGLKLSNKGLFTFATGQTFPGAGSVTSVGLSAPNTDFTVSGSPVTKSGTLALNWNVAPTFINTANAVVKRDSSGSFNANAVIATVVQAFNPVSGGDGVFGQDDSGIGVHGFSVGGTGIVGTSKAGSKGFGVEGVAIGSDGIGIGGSTGSFGQEAQAIFGTAPIGVIGDSSTGFGIVATSDTSNALLVQNGSTADTAVINNLGGGAPLFASGSGGSLFFDSGGNLNITGLVFAAAKDFKIDHPLDPANKYLYHSSVESSEMMNIYTGNVTTDTQGDAAVELPDWFETLNGDFRYQLTVIGQFAQAIVAEKIAHHQFAIKTDKPNVEVSWLVTGVRHDAFAKTHRLQVSVDKSTSERGYYVHPELYGAPVEKSLASAHLAQVMQHAKEKRVQPTKAVKP
jgi:hypothetical protein